ncbi:MAG: methyltransferase domain-containing protein [Chloroflexi bacterium]|nr:methyltransferase domain-containing protein [Chloroflexota bacterium]
MAEGVPVFSQRDAFYEGRWAETDASAGSLRNLVVKKERFFVQQLRGRRGMVLDLGCGGGWRLYTTVGPVIGIDLSFASLRQASHIYDQVVQADLADLPFATSSFDFVVSSDVLGHILPENKGGVLGEIYRVLKRGGRTLHYIETDGEDPLMRFAKRFPDLYQSYIISPEGHVGLEAPSEVVARFRQTGFRPLCEMPVYRGPMYLQRIVQCFDNEYKEKSAAMAALVTVSRFLLRLKPLGIVGNLGVSLFLEVGDRLLPPEWAGGLLVCYEKVS